jgi:polar amino acid transport system permease protein
LVALGFAFADAQILWDDVPGFFALDVMLEGLWNTISLAVVAQAGAIVIGVVIALMRQSANPVARWFAGGYIWIFRGLPVLLQILIWFNLALVFPRIAIPGILDAPTNTVITAFGAALLGLGLNESAYMAEIVRAGLNSVDPGQIEAAKAIGMTPMKTLTRVTLPQAMRVIVPPTGNDFINMLKGTSIASVIGYLELIKAAGNISSRNLEIMETLVAAAVWYMIVVSVASVGQYYLERAFDAADRAHRVRNKVSRSLKPMLRR